jgi:hypothetical protein
MIAQPPCSERCLPAYISGRVSSGLTFLSHSGIVPGMSYPRSPPGHATIVQPLDAATVLSQQVRSDQANAPVTMSWSGQSFGVTGAALESETPPE